jgi:hypothetical protein
VLAQEEALLLGHHFIGTEHILLGLIHEEEGVAAKVLDSLGISLGAVRERVRETIGPAGSTTTGSPPFTPRAKKVLELALREALQLDHNYIGTEHMLLGLVREGEGVAAQVLVQLGAGLDRVRERVIEVLRTYEGMSGAAGLAPARARLPAVGGEQVAPAELPLAPDDLVTWEDAEAELRSGLGLHSTFTTEAEVDGVRYRTSTFQLRTPPTISVSVASAEVSRAAFDAFTDQSNADEPVEGLGEAASFNPEVGRLRVLQGSTLFVIVVGHHEDPLACATALARRALQRLGEGPSRQP